MKKIVSIVLSCLVVFCMLSCVNATTLDETTDAGKTKIEYSVGETYTVVIPEEIVVAKNTETPVEYSVAVKDLLIPYGSSLDVSVEYEGKLKLFEHSATTLGYQIIKSSDSSVLSNGDKVISVPAGTVEEQTENLTAVLTETPVIAGNYEDIATFKINVDGGESQYGEAVQMWEISATEGDDVWMTYYQPKATTYSTRMTTTEVYEDGTIYITGTGNMEQGIYNHFISIEGYVQQCVRSIEEDVGYNVRAEYDTTLDDAQEVSDTILFYIDDENAGDENGEQVYLPAGWHFDTTDENAYKFVPTAVVIDDGVTNISAQAFTATHISTIELPASITIIDLAAFAGCSNLTEITIPSSVESIGDGAFVFCTQLTTVNLCEGLQSIGSNAFKSCTNLTSVTIPESVTSIPDDAFDGSGLTTIKGVAGSYAETFANSNDYTFVAI